MHETVNLNTFISSFKAIRPENFSPEGLELIYEFLITYEDDTNMEVELDVIAICCDFSEMTQSEVADAYSLKKSDIDSVVNYLEDQTLFLGVTSNDTFVFQNF